MPARVSDIIGVIVPATPLERESVDLGECTGIDVLYTIVSLLYTQLVHCIIIIKLERDKKCCDNESQANIYRIYDNFHIILNLLMLASLNVSKLRELCVLYSL